MSDQRLIDRLRSGPPVLMDGAMNTELAKKGFVFNDLEWLRVNLDQPEAVAAVHASYARAGAELHIANSFSTGKHVTEHYGIGDEFKALNAAAVTVCKEAVTKAADGAETFRTVREGDDVASKGGATFYSGTRDAVLNLIH